MPCFFYREKEIPIHIALLCSQHSYFLLVGKHTNHDCIFYTVFFLLSYFVSALKHVEHVNHRQPCANIAVLRERERKTRPTNFEQIIFHRVSLYMFSFLFFLIIRGVCFCARSAQWSSVLNWCCTLYADVHWWFPRKTVHTYAACYSRSSTWNSSNSSSSNREKKRKKPFEWHFIHRACNQPTHDPTYTISKSFSQIVGKIGTINYYDDKLLWMARAMVVCNECEEAEETNERKTQRTNGFRSFILRKTTNCSFVRVVLWTWGQRFHVTSTIFFLSACQLSSTLFPSWAHWELGRKK